MEQNIQLNIGICLIVLALFIALVAQSLRLNAVNRRERNLRAQLVAEQKSADAHQSQKWAARTEAQIESETIELLRAHIALICADNEELFEAKCAAVDECRTMERCLKAAEAAAEAAAESVARKRQGRDVRCLPVRAARTYALQNLA